MESEKLKDLNKKIAELKKRILLAEGQKKANSEEWEKQKKMNLETIANLKKESRDLTAKLTSLKNPTKRSSIKPQVEPYGKPLFPVGAKNVEDALEIMDLRAIEMQKQHDLLRDRYRKKQKLFNKLFEEYRDLLTYKDNKCSEITLLPPAETSEEDANRKLVCHLENEIHRTNVQWMEAEHIRKKYRSIKASLMSDSERFEKSLRELEEALTEQQAEINRLQQVHKEAIEMRDASKIILQRQEQQANISTRAREKQALDFRKQVEERKMELERIERKLFSTGKNLVHQESVGSSSGDQLTGKTEQDDDPNAQLKSTTTELEATFKKLMEVTGATTAQEVLSRFLLQKESSSRLAYLRTVAEGEKKHLEVQRDILAAELEHSKFASTQDTEVNQEEVENLKTEIAENIRLGREYLEISERTQNVIASIRETLVEIIFRLQEVDETDITTKSKTITTEELPDYLLNDASDEDIIDVLEAKLSRIITLTAPKEEVSMEEELSDEFKLDDLSVPLSSPRAASPPPSVQQPIFDEKPQPLPTCYINLISGRAGQSSSASPGQTPQPVGSDDEIDIPTRAYLKKQAMVIVDSKSRRKGFRQGAQRRK